MTSSQLTYVFDLAKRLHRQRRSKRQATKCVRKEYRVLSTQERADFHRAVIALKKNEVSQSVDGVLLLLWAIVYF